MLALVIRQLARGGDVIRVLRRNQFVVEVAIARILELELDHALVVRHLLFHTRRVDTHSNAREAGLLSYVLPIDRLSTSGVSEISSVYRLHKQRIGIARWRGNGESVLREHTSLLG